jgi:hypothetical protein
MDTLQQLRTEVKAYIDTADIKVVKMVHAMLEVEQEGDWWQDQQMLTLVKKRSASLSSGKIKGVPWEKAKAHILKQKRKSDTK